MPPRRRPTAHAEPPPPSPPPLDGLEPAALVPVDAEEARTETAACPFCGGLVTPADERCPRCAAKVVPPHAKSIDVIRGNARTVYVLQALALLCVVPAVPGLIKAYANRGAARDTWLDSHCEWQIDTFWGMFWFWLVGVAVDLVGGSLLWDGSLGRGPTLLVMFAAYAWYIGRLVKGWTRLSDGDPVTDY